MKKRYEFQCWNCPKVYFQSLEISDQKKLIVTCPYCDAEAVVDLRPYFKPLTTVMRKVDLYVDNSRKDNEGELQLPDVLPTIMPE